MSQTILVCDDDKEIAAAVDIYLTAEGYRVIKAYDGLQALEQLQNNPDVQLILMDIMMPRLDGMHATMKIRESRNIPIIMLSAKSEDNDKILGLNIGADDYITKPFGTSELLARLRTAIRHTRTTSGNASIAKENRFIARGLVIDYDKYRVYIDGRDAGLTQNEFKLVALLGRYAGRVLTYDYLIREIWGPNKAYDNQILRVNMANIRRKIEKNPAEPEYIFTEVGVGYRMIEGD